VVHPLRERYWLHALFLATIFTTLTVGAGMQFNFQQICAYSADDSAAHFFHCYGSYTTLAALCWDFFFLNAPADPALYEIGALSL